MAAQMAGVLSRLADGVLGEAGRAAWDALVRLVGRAGKRGVPGLEAESGNVLAELAAHPGDAVQLTAASHVIERLADADPEFAALLREWWVDAERLVREGDVRSENVIHGNVTGSVVQARDIHGAVSFGEQRPSG